MAKVNYSNASKLLNSFFNEAISACSYEVQTHMSQLQSALDIVFASNTQSYREVLLGCSLVHITNPEVNIRLPYIKQGANAFNGRTLDEQVINPFLISKQIPCSRGPYLATFRRNVHLDISARDGLRDKIGYDAMLEILSTIENANSTDAKNILLCLLHKFIELREKADIKLVSVARLSVEQYRHFLDVLLHTQSGGLIPMLITEAIFETINMQYSCNWKIDRQGINAADGATGAAGDVTISKDGEIVKAIEVTERPIQGTRVVTTFNSKISTSNVQEYLFVYTSATPSDDAYAVAKTYFSQGYDINFIKLSNFVISVFMAGNSTTRSIFMEKMLTLLRQGDIPASVKTAWNDALQSTIQN